MTDKTYYKLVDRMAMVITRKFEKLMRRYFNMEREMLLKKFRQQLIIFDFRYTNDFGHEYLTEEFTKIFRSSGYKVYKFYDRSNRGNISKSEELQDPEDEWWSEIRTIVGDIVGLDVTSILNTNKEMVNKMLREEIQSYLEEGLSYNEMTDRLADKIGGIHKQDRWRAARIARTEAGSVLGINAGKAIEDAKAEGLGVEKKWLVSRDGRERPTHNAVTTRFIDSEELFSVGDQMLAYPHARNASAKNRINCRCALRTRAVII